MASEMKLLTLEEWARLRYATPPAKRTLWRWAREGQIFPIPRRHGKEYRVQEDAKHVNELTLGTRL